MTTTEPCRCLPDELCTCPPAKVAARTELERNRANAPAGLAKARAALATADLRSEP